VNHAIKLHSASALAGKVRKLRLDNFPCDVVANGWNAFQHPDLTRNAVAIHANWMVSSSTKEHCFREAGLWQGPNQTECRAISGTAQRRQTMRVIHSAVHGVPIIGGCKHDQLLVSGKAATPAAASPRRLDEVLDPGRGAAASPSASPTELLHGHACPGIEGRFPGSIVEWANSSVDVMTGLDRFWHPSNASMSVAEWPIFVVTYMVPNFENRRCRILAQLHPRKVIFVDASEYGGDNLHLKGSCCQNAKHMKRQLGAFRSHLALWKAIARVPQPGSGVLVLEDDSEIVPDLFPRLRHEAQGLPPPPNSSILVRGPQWAGEQAFQMKRPWMNRDGSALFFGSCSNLYPDNRDLCVVNPAEPDPHACSVSLRVPADPKLHPYFRPLSRCTHAYALQRECAQMLMRSVHQAGAITMPVDRWLNLKLRRCTVLFTRDSWANQSVEHGVVVKPVAPAVVSPKNGPYRWMFQAGSGDVPWYDWAGSQTNRVVLKKGPLQNTDPSANSTSLTRISIAGRSDDDSMDVR